MRTRTWFLLSLALFLAAAVCWRLGDRRRERAPEAGTRPAANAGAEVLRFTGARPNPYFQSPAPRAGRTARGAAAVAADSVAASGVTNYPDKKYPFRLRNTPRTAEELLRVETALHFRNALIDTAEKTGLAIPAHLQAGPDADSFVVQARGAIDAAFRAQLQSAGAQIVAYVPNNAYLVRVPAGGAPKLAALTRAQSVLPYQPYFKLESDLLELAVAQQSLPFDQYLNVAVFPGRRDAAVSQLRALGAQVVQEQPTPFGEQLTIRPPANSLVAIAQLKEVQIVETARRRHLLSDLTRVTLNISRYSTDTTNYLNLSGKGVNVVVVDDGIDDTVPALSGRVITSPILPRPPIFNTNTSPHGTAVAAVLGGNGTNGPTGTNAPGSAFGASFRGMAHQANLIPLPIDINDDFVTLTFPFVYSDAQLQQFAARLNTNSIVNNSWGYGPGGYSLASASYDASVRDGDPYRTNSQPLLQVFAAGNDGFGQPNGLSGVADTINAPGNSKNSITVGAVELERNITNVFTNLVTGAIYSYFSETDSRSQVASYSSRGPVGQGIEGSGRFKPDVVAPGNFLVTLKNSLWTTNSDPLIALLDGILTNGTTAPYRFESGTSMSAAAVSGMLALMQEFYEQKLQMTNSPALMKALLINGARSVGNAAYDFSPTNSVIDQGNGLPNLTNSIPYALSAGPATTNTWPIIIRDQNPTNALATGESHSWLLSLTNGNPALQAHPTNYPLRITLVWTDPPGNPVVGTKLVNDLDLVVFDPATTNYYFGNNIEIGREFNKPVGFDYLFGTNTATGPVNPIPDPVYNRDTNPLQQPVPSDVINNVENVFIDGPVPTNLVISVVGRRVNVNAVTQNTNNVVQDYALVISSGNSALTNVFLFSTRTNNAVTNRIARTIYNGIPILKERVGANYQLYNPTNGVTNQWNFYVFTNTFQPLITNVQFGITNVIKSSVTNGTNIAFVTFRPPNLSRPRNLEADIDLFVSTNPALTNLDSLVINSTATLRATNRLGSEAIIITNGVLDQTYYIGVKSEDQQASEYGLVVISSASFGDNDGVNVTLKGLPLPAVIPDGTPEQPEGIEIFYINPFPITLVNVAVTNIITHENYGDLVGVLNHDGQDVTLFNHSLHNGTNSGTFTNVFDERYPDKPVTNNPAAPFFGSTNEVAEGPGALQSFVGHEGVGLWILSVQDNAPFHTGQVDQSTLRLTRQKPNNGVVSGTLDIGEFFFDFIDVPPNATNLIITLTNTTADLFLGIVRVLPNPPSTNFPGFDKFAIITPTGGSLTNDFTDVPPLTSGRYLIVLENVGAGITSFDLTKRLGLSLVSNGEQIGSSGLINLPIIDDGITTNSIVILTNRLVTGVNVSFSINHPRASDLVITLISPKGKRVLLAENRGGISSNLSATNFYANFTEDTNLTTYPYTNLQMIKFAAAPFTNLISPPQLFATNLFGGGDDQSAAGIAIMGSGMFVVGVSNVYNLPYLLDGMIVRYDLPFINGMQPTWSTNWPGDNSLAGILPTVPTLANGNDFFTAVVAGPDGVYAVGQSFSMATNSGNILASKGMVVGFPFGDTNGVAGPSANPPNPVVNGAFWFTQIPHQTAAGTPFPYYDAPNVVNAVTLQQEQGTNYLYVTGSGVGSNTASPRMFVTKLLATNGVIIWSQTNGSAAYPDASSGNGLATMSNNVFVAGVTNLVGVGDFPILNVFTNDGTLKWQAISPNPGQYKAVTALGKDIYAVGFVDNGTINKKDFLIEKWTMDFTGPLLTGSLIWSKTIDRNASVAGFSEDDVLNGVAALGDRVYAAGYTKFGPLEGRGGDKDLILMEFDAATGALVSTNMWAAAKNNDPASGDDIGTAITTDGNDLYITGETTSSGATNKDMVVLRYRVKNYYQPEESLFNFAGEPATLVTTNIYFPTPTLNPPITNGAWTLEILDNRAGPDPAILPTPSLVSWSLDLFFAPTNVVADILYDDLPPFRFPLAKTAAHYFMVDAPIAATAATNIIAASQNVKLTFNANRLPIPGAAGNITLVLSSTNITSVLGTNGPPKLIPGRRYYLGVENVNKTLTNSAEISLHFDRKYALPVERQLVSGTPVTNTLSLNRGMDYYQFNVSPGAAAATFELQSLTGNANLFVRKAVLGPFPLPAATKFDYLSANAGTRNEMVFVITNAPPVPLSTGLWYLAVQNADSRPVTYTVKATESATLPLTEFNLTPGVAVSDSTSAGNSPNRVFKVNIPAQTNAVLFELFNISGDASLLLRKGAYPTAAAYDLGSFRAGVLPEQIVLRTNTLAGVTNISGAWYLAVPNSRSYSADFAIRVAFPTNGILVSMTPPAFTQPTRTGFISGSTVQAGFGALPGEKYQVQWSTNLVNWNTLTNIVAPPGGQISFTDPGGLTNKSRYYRVKQIP